jgi:hypothetical protein
MYHWLIILFGILILSISVSNPFYNLTINKFIKFNLFFRIILRILLFILSILIVFLGLFIESVP